MEPDRTQNEKETGETKGHTEVRIGLDHLWIFMSIVGIASVLQASTGFGFSIMATPFLLLLFAPREAIQINIIISLVISLAFIWKIRSEIDRVLLNRLLLGSIIGVPFGVLLFVNLRNIDLFKLGISIILLLLTLLLICKMKLTRTRNRDWLAGGISGLLTTSIGMPGPPLLLYFAGTGTDKAALRATTLAFYLFIYAVSLLTQILFAGTSLEIWKSSLYALPVVAMGLFLGQLLFRWISQKLFRWMTYAILLFTGGYLLVESLRALI